MFKPTKRLSEGEFVTMMAVLTALLALAIDAMLPALPDIGRDLGVADLNDTTWVVSTIFIGFAIGQIFYGPISDSMGRKNPIYIGLGLYIVGCLISVLAWNFEVMLVGRFIQGLGVAGPKIVSMALIRDEYAGRGMARIMSFIMAIFILVPAIAPSIGQLILLFAEWRMIFAMLFGMAFIGLFWFAARQPETLPREKRAPLSWSHIKEASSEVFANHVVMGYTITMGLSFGAFIGYLNSAQQIFQSLYGLGEMFPLYFGALALAIGAAAIVNTKLVMRFGMRYLCWKALKGTTALSFIFLAYTLWLGEAPALELFMLWGMLSFFCMGILFGNFNALSMEPVGHIAGVAAAIIGFISTIIAAILGATIGLAFDGTVAPLVGGFAVLCLISIFVMAIADKKARQTI